ncbi:MAG: ATP-binding cassette domain-containing protein [Succinivibrio sp.]|nr:ATP-binding cassette domain-containing protein [Succinivibrio sp.]
MIRLENVSVAYEQFGRTFKAVDRVSLEVRKGEFLGIVGTSGAGKSTLVRTINLLQRPTSGKVFIKDQEITSLKGRELSKLRQNIGMIFQHFNLIKNASVFDNVAFALKASDTPKAEIAPRVTELLKLVGLEKYERSYPNDLSGGQKQRVAIARALANSPEILLCDEATSALDPDNTQEVIQSLVKIKESYPITVVFITHQMEVAKSLFDRVAVMSKGRIVEVGSSYQIFSRPESTEAQKLVKRSLSYSLPEEVKKQAGDLYQIVFKEESAYEPTIAEISRKLSVDLSIIAGGIEYIQKKPLGSLVVSLSRSLDANKKREVLDFLNQRAFVSEYKEL